jgi:hypothetical protein
MDLTRGEFSQFNLKSRVNLLKQRGILLASKIINTVYEIRLFMIYGFYVEVFYNCLKRDIIKAELVISKNWQSLYL